MRDGGEVVNVNSAIAFARSVDKSVWSVNTFLQGWPGFTHPEIHKSEHYANIILKSNSLEY